MQNIITRQIISAAIFYLPPNYTKFDSEDILLTLSTPVPQIPMPSQGAKPPPNTTPTLTTEQAAQPSALKTQQVQATGGEEVKTNKKKKEKGGKREKAPPAPEAPVDVSRLDFRIGKITRAWKHPDADTLYVEEGIISMGVKVGLTMY